MYHIFDISIECDLHLPELSKGSSREPAIKIMSGVDSKRVHCEPEYFHEWRDDDGQIFMLSAKIEDTFLLRFPELVDFLISTSGDTVFYFPEPNIPEETIRHLLLDQIIPRILGQRGHLVLHASAVQLSDGKAIVFLGNTGWGKSTIASSYHGLRLYPDSAEAIFKAKAQYKPVAHYTNKERLILDTVESTIGEPIPVSAIFLLSDPNIGCVNRASVNKIRGAKEIMAIVEQSFLLDIKDKAINSKQFTNASEVNEVSPVLYELSYPRQYEMLEEVRNTVKTIAMNII